MSNIKEKIGQRILEARKVKGLTRLALANLTEDLKQSRINNWERGLRTPGPNEVKQLAEALEVSAAFLMCLSDDKLDNRAKDPSHYLIPLLDRQQACDAKAHIESIKDHHPKNKVLIPVSTALTTELNHHAFALRMSDNSMLPEFRLDDVLIINSIICPNPSDYVVVKISEKDEVIICQYKKLSYTSKDFELLTLNDNWPNIKNAEALEIKIIGKVIQVIREYN